jgi:hypothetical protein
MTMVQTMQRPGGAGPGGPDPRNADAPIRGGGGEAGEGQADQLERILPMVDRWTGGMASLWTYTISHGKLVLRLTRPSVRGNLHLTCYDCRRICAPTFWGNVNLQIVEEQTPEGRRLVLTDEANKVEIRCGYLVAAENVEPVY